MAYFPFYAFEEIPAVFGDKPDQLHSLTTAIKQLTSAITDGAVTDMPPLAEGEAEREKARKEIVGWFLRKAVEPAISSLRRFEEMLTVLTPEHQQNMLNALSRLVQIGDRDSLNARSVAIDQFGDSQRLIESFVEAKLLLATESGGGRTVAFADPVIVDKWDALRQWILEHRQMLIVRQTLGAALQSWVLRDSDRARC